MYDDPITPSHDPSESGQDNDSVLFKYLSLLGSAANGYRQQLQEQYPPQDASMLDFLKQVRGLPAEEPQNDAMQRLSGLFKSDSPSPDENQGLSFLPRLSPIGPAVEYAHPRRFLHSTFLFQSVIAIEYPKSARQHSASRDS